MAVNPLEAFAQGQGLVNSFTTQLGQRQAGRALAQGDYASAMSSLFNSGDIGGGLQLQGLQQQQQELQRSRQDEQRKRQVQFTMQATKALRGAVQEGQDPIAVYDSFQPAFQALGVAPEELGQYRQALAANPTAFLDTVEQAVGQAARELEIVNYGSGRGAVAVDKNTGEIVNEFGPAAEPIKVGDVLVDPVTYEPILDAREPRYQTVTNTDGSTSVVAIDQPAPIRGAGGGSNDLAGIKQRLFAREGGYVARDGSSGAPANFGINQRANPDVDVANLTRERAEQIYDERYIKPILDAGVSGPALEAVIDFGVNAGPNRALDFWRRSGGDINRFNELRLNHYRSLPDYNRYGRSWERRVAETTPGTVDTRGGTRVVAQGQNRGLSPSEQRAVAREERAEQREQQREQAGSRRDEVNLRREFNNRQEVKDYATVRSAYQSVQAAARQPSAAGDLSLIFAYMKILDPGSVVREQEFANAQNAAGVPDRVRNLYNRALNGQRLNPNQRQDFLTQANNLFQTRQQTYDRIAGEYRGYAESYGVSPDRVAPIERGSTSNQPRTNAPGLRFNITESQLQTRQRLIQQGASPSAPLGSTRNPRYLNPADPSTSYGNIPRGQHYVSPDGQIRQKR